MQRLVSIQYTDEELAQMDAALNTLRVRFSRVIALQPDERRELTNVFHMKQKRAGQFPASSE